MRGPFDVMLRWWNFGQANSKPGRADSPLPVHVEVKPPETIEEPRWLAQLDRDGIPRTLNYPTTTLGRVLDQTAERFGDVTAVIYNQKRWSYRDLLGRVNRLAGGLSRMGVRKGDRVVMALPNCPEYVLCFFAIQKLGAIVVNAGPLMGADDLRALTELTRPRIVIGLDLLAARITNACHHFCPEHFVWVTLQSYQNLIRRLGYQLKLWQGREKSNGSTAEHTTLKKIMENAPARPPTIDPDPNSTAVLQPTSGTTGALKLAQLSHRNLLANATQVGVWMNARDGQERVLSVLPMFHVYGLTTGLINPVFGGASMILMTRFDAQQTIEVLLREKPTVFPLVPAICDAVSSRIESMNPRPTFSGLRLCISGAAPLPRDTAERFEKLTGGRVIEGYGLSESSPVTHANLPSRPRYGSIGLPMPDTMCRVADLDDEKRDAPMGHPGELLVSGPQVMSGYFANPEATERALLVDDHGRTWLRTGDVVRMDEDGFFQVLDRRKDMIIRSGLKIYPAKVEKVLLTHARVADAAVIGRADPLHTEEVVAYVVCKDEHTDHATLITELRALCREHLAPYEVPSKIEFTNAIPRNALGKVLKKELRQRPEAPPQPPKRPEKPQPERKAA